MQYPQSARPMVAAVLLLLCAAAAQGQTFECVVNLFGKWKFELGDNRAWSEPSFNDSKWAEIDAPSPWEDQGYPGYDGYAWYRKHVKLDQSLRGKYVYIQIGGIDDVSEIFVNGHMVGFAGVFPPEFKAGDGIFHSYFIPQEYLNLTGDNVIAVRVYDLRLAGGIIRGPIGLYERRVYMKPDVDLAGMWKFSIGDNEVWAKEWFDDSRWGQIMVPGYWETQGYRGYDGFGWYRLKFKVPDDLINQELVLLAGKIDDVDEVYINGELIGRTGRMDRGTSPDKFSEEWKQYRIYPIPPGLLHRGGSNTIAVRVLDVIMKDGIYDGPVGIIRADFVPKDKVSQPKKKSFWDFIKDLFD